MKIIKTKNILLLLAVLVTTMLIGWPLTQKLIKPTQKASILAYQVDGNIEYVDGATGELTILDDQEMIYPNERVISREDGTAIFVLPSRQAVVQIDPLTSIIFKSENPEAEIPEFEIELEIGQLLVAAQNTSLALTTSAGKAHLNSSNGIMWASVSYPGIKTTFQCISGPCLVENKAHTAQLSTGEYAILEDISTAWTPKSDLLEVMPTPLTEMAAIPPENNQAQEQASTPKAKNFEEPSALPLVPALITIDESVETPNITPPSPDENHQTEDGNLPVSTPTPFVNSRERNQLIPSQVAGDQSTPEPSPVSLANLELNAGTWFLTAFGDPGAQESVPESLDLTLEFDNETGAITGLAGCNWYLGETTTPSENQISVLNLSRTTKMACGEGVTAYESIYLDLLGKMTSYQFYENNLNIFTEDNRVLTFQLGEFIGDSTPSRPSLATPTPEGPVYYVAVGGNDNNPGTFELPWASLQKAANTAKAGDTVYFREGTYYGGLYISSIGTENAWIVFTAYPGEKPRIINNSGDAVSVRTYPLPASKAYEQMASYVEVSGFSLKGSVKGVRIDQAHHVRILDNVIYDSAKGGISAPNGADHILIQGNVIYGNSNGGAPCSSGISIWNTGCFFGETNTCHVLNDGAGGYHIVIKKNLIYANRNDDSSCSANGPTDGNGIIMDNNGANNPLTLIENNILLRNGGRCIQVLNTSNTHIYNNTCYQNVQTPRLIDNGSGELQISEFVISGYEMDTTNVEFKNNLVYGHGEASLFRVWGISGDMPQYIEDNNLFFNGLLPGSIGDNSITADPKLVKLPTCSAPYTCDWSSFNFNLMETSPAIDAGASLLSVFEDYEGTKRPQGDGYDIGAYERIQSP